MCEALALGQELELAWDLALDLGQALDVAVDADLDPVVALATA